MSDELLKGILCDESIEKEQIIEKMKANIEESLMGMSNYQARRFVMSELNYCIRSEYKSSELVGFKVNKGDICYIDYGKAYITEAGFQHFGLVLGICNSKAFVIPMSSNKSMYYQSYCKKTFPQGKKHLYRLPDLEGLNKKSVLFLNDAKYINTARVISVNAYIDPDSDLFKDILSSTIQLIVDSDGY